MNEIYDLNQDKNKYKTMKENVNKMINVLSSNDIPDNLQSVLTSLNSDYTINDTAVKYNKINSQKDKVRDCIDDLKELYEKIKRKISSIDDDIKDAEQKEREKDN